VYLCVCDNHNLTVFVLTLDLDRFLVHDEESERKFHFNLATSLRKAASGRLLVGYRIHVTPKVQPEPKQMKGAKKMFAVF